MCANTHDPNTITFIEVENIEEGNHIDESNDEKAEPNNTTETHSDFFFNGNAPEAND